MTIDVRLRLADELRTAMRARDRTATSALRSVSAAIANAEAVAESETPTRAAGSEYVAGAVGVGTTEAPRRELSLDDVAAIVIGEATRLESTAVVYDRAGHPSRADRLRLQAEVVRALLR